MSEEIQPTSIFPTLEFLFYKFLNPCITDNRTFQISLLLFPFNFYENPRLYQSDAKISFFFQIVTHKKTQKNTQIIKKASKIKSFQNSPPSSTGNGYSISNVYAHIPLFMLPLLTF